MSRRLVGLTCFALSALLSLTSCGSESAAGSEYLEMDLAAGGIILPTDNQTCVDKVSGDGTRSATKNSMSFPSLRLNWKPRDKDGNKANRSLYVGLIRITVKSSRIAGGSQEFTLAGDEIEALLGASGQIIDSDLDSGNTIEDTEKGEKPVVSNKSTNRNGFPNCAFVIGGITLSTTSTTSFSANVTIELIGQGSGSSGPNGDPLDGSDPFVVRKTFSTTATYY